MPTSIDNTFEQRPVYTIQLSTLSLLHSDFHIINLIAFLSYLSDAFRLLKPKDFN